MSQDATKVLRLGCAQRSAAAMRVVPIAGTYCSRIGTMISRIVARWAFPAGVGLCLTLGLLAARARGQSPAADAAVQAPADSSAKTCPTFRVREQDQVWLVSTRCLGCPSGKETMPGWQLWQYEKATWQPRTTAEFYAADSAKVVTPFYIHGNRIDHGLASSDGLAVYFQMAGKFDDEPPVRFVIWSWPSSQIKGPLNDVRTKADRSDVEAYYVGRFLAGMQPDVRTGLIGYSYGARITCGAMHLLGGGSQIGLSIEAGPRPKARVALWAAGEHNHWLLPGHYHGEALKQAERWFITQNCCDPALARYHFVDPCSNPVALGFSGMYGRNLLPAEQGARIEEVNVSNIIGGTHDNDPYIYSLYIQNRTREYALWHELPELKPAPAAALTAAK